MKITNRQRIGKALLLLMLASMAGSASAQTSTNIRSQTDPAEQASEGVRASPRYLLQNGRGRAVMVNDFRNRFQLIAFWLHRLPGRLPNHHAGNATGHGGAG